VNGPLLSFATGVAGALCAHLFQALFAAGEMALINADPSRLRALESQGVRGAPAALRLAAQPERLLAASLIGAGISITSATFLWHAALAATGMRTPLIAVVTIAATLTTEVLAKGLARGRPERLAALLAQPLGWLGWLGVPLGPVTRLLGGGDGVRRAELALILRERAPGGERQIGGLFTALRLGRMSAGRAMRPVATLIGLPESAPVSALEILPGRRTRIALLDAEGRPDGRLVSVKSALGLPPATPLASLAIDSVRLPEATPLGDALELMRSGGHEFVFIVRGAAITGFLTQYDLSRLLLQELPQEAR